MCAVGQVVYMLFLLAFKQGMHGSVKTKMYSLQFCAVFLSVLFLDSSEQVAV